MATRKRRRATPSGMRSGWLRTGCFTGIANGHDHVFQKTHAICGLHHDLHLELGGSGGVPRHVNHALRMIHQALHVGAVGPVDADATAAGDEAHDVVAGNRVAAMCQVDQQVRIALTTTPQLVFLRMRWLRRRIGASFMKARRFSSSILAWASRLQSAQESLPPGCPGPSWRCSARRPCRRRWRQTGRRKRHTPAPRRPCSKP